MQETQENGHRRSQAEGDIKWEAGEATREDTKQEAGTDRGRAAVREDTEQEAEMDGEAMREDTKQEAGMDGRRPAL